MNRGQPQLRRLYWIDAALQQGDYPSAPDLAQELAVAAGTLRGDLRVLRETYRAPITFDPTRGGFCYGHAFRPQLPPLPLEAALELAEALPHDGPRADCALGDTLQAWRERLEATWPAAGPDRPPGKTQSAGTSWSARGRREGPAPRASGRRKAKPAGGPAGAEDGSVAIRLRFDPAATRPALDSGIFSPGEVQLLTGGGFEATVATGDPDAFLLSLVQWAPHFAVVGPPWARQRLPQLLRRVLRQIEPGAPRRRKPRAR